MRGRSYTPSPPRGYGRRGRSPSPRGRYVGRSRDMPASLLVRNLHHDCRFFFFNLFMHFLHPKIFEGQLGKFGALKDIYLPRDYYTGEPRGFGFVQYVDPADAAEAKYHMDGYVLLGWELTVVFAEENRKKPTEMRARERISRGRSDRRQSLVGYSWSPPPRHARSRSRSRDYYSHPAKRRYSSQYSPRPSQERSYSRSPPIDGSPSRSESPARGKSRS
ncbi:hypothetical protein ACJRO7_004766 [Eucalyptus globulus]|uniref:RRM domain-containing protein n=1 Tax=Eucalyptus globulus TaxID=34317 RepID=A0ABD3J2U5_EUCGL